MLQNGYEPIRRHLRVELQPLLHGRDRSEHRQTIDARFDVRRSTELIGQHLGNSRDLIFWRNDQRDHASAVAVRGGRKREIRD